MERKMLLGAWGMTCLLAGAVLLGVGCGGGGSSPTEPDPPMMNLGSATFRLVGSGYDDTLSVGGGGSLVFCRRNAGFADLFIRFAQQSADDGGNGPHLDIDLCNLGDGGNFAPRDPQSTHCAGKTWDIWWHGDQEIFFNQITSPACTLSLSRDGNSLSGNFSCRGMVELDGGSGTLDVLDGAFQCTIS